MKWFATMIGSTPKAEEKDSNSVRCVRKQPPSGGCSCDTIWTKSGLECRGANVDEVVGIIRCGFLEVGDEDLITDTCSTDILSYAISRTGI